MDFDAREESIEAMNAVLEDSDEQSSEEIWDQNSYHWHKGLYWKIKEDSFQSKFGRKKEEHTMVDDNVILEKYIQERNRGNVQMSLKHN